MLWPKLSKFSRFSCFFSANSVFSCFSSDDMIAFGVQYVRSRFLLPKIRLLPKLTIFCGRLLANRIYLFAISTKYVRKYSVIEQILEIIVVFSMHLLWEHLGQKRAASFSICFYISKLRSVEINFGTSDQIIQITILILPEMRGLIVANRCNTSFVMTVALIVQIHLNWLLSCCDLKDRTAGKKLGKLYRAV